jgi:hypothetical protein
LKTFYFVLLTTFINFEKKMFLFDNKYGYYESNYEFLMYCDIRGHAHLKDPIWHRTLVFYDYT